jgi:2-aminomuconate deaminase
MERHNTVHSNRAAEPVGAYPHARRIGDLLFLAGIGPRQRGSKDIPGVVLAADGSVQSYDIEAQMRSCFENVRIILEEAGSSWENIVDVLVFLTDMKRDFAAYNRLWAEYFPPGPNQPTRTTIEVRSLPQAGSAPIAFEVKVVAIQNRARKEADRAVPPTAPRP